MEWIKKILILYLVFTLFTRLLPNERYSRYCRVFLGMFFCLIALQDVPKIFGMEENIEQLYHKWQNSFQTAQMENMIENMEGEMKEKQIGKYEQAATKSFAGHLQTQGYYLYKMEYVWEGNQLNSIKMHVGTTKRGEIYIEPIQIMEQERNTRENKMEKDIKSLAKNFYNLSEDNILINIQEDNQVPGSSSP